ncbi:deoxyribose-phosphate aldolase [Mobilicoccus massiliensis]|uniref:deoxyribose-phosphate aldolase n=1 Tax=Mobilicoccus massiliensis TaxID=1522310 RepID=UPI00058DB064|nr:deoxyribose-phosphate aldolase [Mobilicoccus massiliensis]
MPSRREVARLVDHTLLTPEATHRQVADVAAEAGELGAFAVCVSPSRLPVEAPAGVRVAAVCGFPTGAHAPEIKAAEAARAVSDDADEIDMVVDLGLVREGRFAEVEREIRAVRDVCPPAGERPVLLKVIIESAALTDAEIVACCEAAERAGADFVKTSTGFHPAGGASVHAVALMRRTVGDRLGVKASGGIRTAEAALAMIDAGATRLGLSGTRAVLDGLPDDDAS